MKKALIIFSFLCAFVSSMNAQIYYAKVSPNVYTADEFDQFGTNELFRNKFTRVISGADTVWYFVDFQGNAALMILGASGGGGGDSTVNVASPIKGDGTTMAPITFINGASSGQYWSWNGSAWVLTAAPTSTNIYNSNGSLTANRTLTGAGFSLTETGLTSRSESGSGNNTTTTTGSGDIVETAADDLYSSAADRYSIISGDTVSLSSGGITSIISGAGMELSPGFDLAVVAGTGASIQANAGNIGLAAFSADGNVVVTMSGTTGMTVEDASMGLEGIKYGSDLCAQILANPLSIPSVACVATMIGDSLADFSSVNIYNSDGTLTGERILHGDGNNLTFDETGTFNVSGGDNVSISCSQNTDIISGNAITLESSAAGVAMNTETGVQVNANTGVPLTIGSVDGLQAVYNADYCDPTDDLGIPNIGCIKSLVHDSMQQIVTLYNGNGTLLTSRSVNGGGTKSMSFVSLTSMSETGSGDNTTTTTGTGDIVEVAGDDITQTCADDYSVAAGDIIQVITTGAALFRGGTGATFSSLTGTATLSGSSLGIVIGGAAGDGIVTDNSTVTNGLEYATTAYEATIKAHGVSLPDVNVVRSIVGDSIPDGTSTRTVRYNSSNLLISTDEIRNDGATVAIGGQAPSAGNELQVNGKTRANGLLWAGTEVVPPNTDGTFSVSDSTNTVVKSYFQNGSAVSGAGTQVIITNRSSAGATSKAELTFFGAAGEGAYNQGYDGLSNKFKFSTDGGYDLNTNTVYTILATNEFGIGTATPTARLNILGQTTDASTAPLKFTKGASLMTAPESGAFEYADSTMYVTTVGSVISSFRYEMMRGLSGKATLDFPATAPGTSSVLTITVAAALQGDKCTVGLDSPGSYDNSVFYSASCTVDGTVNVQLFNLGAVPFNPPSATYNLSVIH